ncbi:uncharacterized protein TNCV_3937601 [Trichonephila clavipes]|nr:uncharacterized protein TNCV_3937601 [Trichonephila clavipes]
MFDPSSFANPTPLAHADTSRDLLPRGGTTQLDCKLNLDLSENITQDHCCGAHNACSLLQVNHRLQSVTVSRTHLTDLRAYGPMCHKSLYTVCLETVVPVNEES